MRLLFFLALLGLAAIGDHASSASSPESNITYFGAPRHLLDGVLPIIDITEDYMRAQIDSGTSKATGTTRDGQCSADIPCADHSCCNSQGFCGFRTEHCRPAAPDTCVSNCNAKAPCGDFSNDGRVVCPLNLCCSYFGTCGNSELFCDHQTQTNAHAPCQGNCGDISVPACATDSGTASRRVAYYEVWNSRRRKCDKILPGQIDTTGLTHLVLAFATIDPKTFEVRPMHPDDEEIYKQFLALPDSVSKWIGLGGWEFNDPGATRFTWSELCSTKENRETFIKSFKQFLTKWNFRGVDIDWEWPGTSSRGGSTADKQNQVSLMSDLRQALGNDFGLSTVLPAQYEYLKYLDPKALEAQVDFLNILTYDLHGTWDASIPGLGPYIKPHTDLKEIDEALKLLWSADVTPKKVNLGVANYGRGFTVADTGCMKYGCQYAGPSKAGTCTEMEGVLSTCEIRRIVATHSLSPQILPGGASVKEIRWDDQWMAYDDHETFDLKLELANSRCLGGTALWAIDYEICDGNGGTPLPGSSVAPSQSNSAPVASITSSIGQDSSAAPTSITSSGIQDSSRADPGVPVTSTQPSSIQSSTASSNFISVPASTASSISSSIDQGSSSSQSVTNPSSQQSPQESSSGFAIPTTTSTPQGSSAQPTSISSAVGISSATSGDGSSTNVQTSSVASFPASPSVSGSESQSSYSGSPSTTAPSSATSPLVSSATLSGTMSSSVQTGSATGSSETSAVSSIAASSSAGGSFAPSSVVASSIPSAPSGTATPSGYSASSSTTAPLSMTIPSDTSIPLSTTVTSSISSPSSTTAVSDTTIPSGTSQLSSGSSAQSTNTPTSGSSRDSASSTFISYSTANPSVTQISGSITQAVPSGTPRKPCPQECLNEDWCKMFCILPVLPSERPPQCDTLVWCKDWWDQSTSTPSASSASSSSPVVTTTSNTVADSTGNTLTTTPGSTIILTPGNSVTTTTGSTVATTSGIVDNDGDPDSHSDNDPDCVPRDCVKECIAWRIATFLLFKRPVCPCIPKKCDQDSDSDSPSDSDKDDPHPHPQPKPSTKPHDIDPEHDSKDRGDHPENGGDEECQMLGCGCGWMGLDYGPGCGDTTFSWDFPKFGFPCGLFGCSPCRFFGCNTPGADINGILGYDGYCLVDGGCDPCPPEICSGPSCTIPGGCGPKPGPPPTQPANRPKSCEEWQKTTVTERFVWCTEGFAVSELPSSIGLTSSTMISSVCVPYVEATLKACPGALLGYTTTTTKTEMSTLTSSDGPACTRAPLSLDDDEGDNMPADGSLSSSIIFSSNTSSIATSTPIPSSTITTSSATRTTSFVVGTSFISPTTSFVVGTSTLSTEKSAPAPIPTGMDRYGNWRVDFTHWMENVNSGINWVLYDPNGQPAGGGGVFGANYEEITHYIETENRDEEHSMLFGVRVTVTDPRDSDKARVKFVIEKDVPNCFNGHVKCRPSMKTEDKTEQHPFEVESCYDKCKDTTLRPADFWCNDLNDAMWLPENGGWKRRFWCGWKGF